MMNMTTHKTPQFVNILLPTESKDMQTPLQNRKQKSMKLSLRTVYLFSSNSDNCHKQDTAAGSSKYFLKYDKA